MRDKGRNPNSERRMPRLLSPINSFEGAVRVIRAGADELYCGVASEIPSIKSFTLYRGTSCNIPTYDELGRVVKYAHDNGVKVILTANVPFMVDAVKRGMRSYICSCLDEGVDALIIGNLGVLSMVRDMGVDIPIYASTYMASMNYEAVDFLKKLGVSRVTLERHLTIPEISEIVQKSRVEIEVFIHGGGCSNINVNCYLLHLSFLPAISRALSMINSFPSYGLCRLPFEVYDVNNRQNRWGNVPILDAITHCSLCRLPDLIQTGVTGFKIVGRCNNIAYQESTTKIYRELIDLIGRGQMKAYQEKLESLRKIFVPMPPTLANLQEYCCEQKRCYYSPLFHAPYKLPISWHAWTKFQFKALGVEG